MPTIRLSTFKKHKYCQVNDCARCDNLVFSECAQILVILNDRGLVVERMDEADWYNLETELKEKGVLIQD